MPSANDESPGMSPRNNNRRAANQNSNRNHIRRDNIEIGENSTGEEEEEATRSEENMKYVIIQSYDAIRGPTICGDHDSDKGLMEFLGAKIPDQGENEYSPIKEQKVYITKNPPRVVLDSLGTLGFKVVGVSGGDRGYSWTLQG
ncbi:GTP cyclohydrolase 1 feedback regulatory protein-like [Convolutriloba macropyga]|uniref:GTP cyclohydrolase 1 feedback regulatory protein-like n=1 Tax=Convolutriloba macropyga TaxID=536237 RepID=UPI003F5251C8